MLIGSALAELEIESASDEKGAAFSLLSLKLLLVARRQTADELFDSLFHRLDLVVITILEMHNWTTHDFRIIVRLLENFIHSRPQNCM